MKKLKILQINKYPYIKGGSEVVVFNTTDLLREKGHDVILLSTDSGAPIYELTYLIPYPDRSSSFYEKAASLRAFFYNKKAVSKLSAILEVEKPDIAHIHLYLNSFSVSILPVLKKYKVPVVMTLHDYREVCPSYLLLDKQNTICEKCKGGNYLNCVFTGCAKGGLMEGIILTMEMYYRRFFYKTENYVDKFICVSRFELEKYKEFNSCISDKSIILNNSIREPSEKAVKRGDYLLFFGRLSGEKGLNTLFAAMKHLLDIKLKVVGEGNLPFANIPLNIEFLGFKKGKELEALIFNAMFTVMPSEYFETFGLSAAESLSLGTPVIASRIGALPEIVEDKKTGFLFTPTDVSELVSSINAGLSLSDEEYIRMGEQGKESVKNFSKENYINKLLAVYEGLIEDKK